MKKIMLALAVAVLAVAANAASFKWTASNVYGADGNEMEYYLDRKFSDEDFLIVDDLDDVKLYNPKSMAKAIAQGILNKTIEDKKTTDEYYRIIAGSFRNRQYAEDTKNKLIKLGFNPFIEVYKK